MSTYYKNTLPVYWGATLNTKWYKEIVMGGEDGDTTTTPITVHLKQRGNISNFPAAVRNLALDHVFDCRRIGKDGVAQGIIVVTFSIEDCALSVSYLQEPLILTTSLLGDFVEGILISDDTILGLLVTMGFPEIVTGAGKGNWIKWSNIGSLDFTVWKDNIAGERPLDWKGWIYAIKKLGNKVIVYGQNGVSMLAPSGNTFGLLPIHQIGLKGRQAVGGNSKSQFFIDNLGRLYNTSELASRSALFEAAIYPGLLDYSEYLSALKDNVILSWDEANNILYICDDVVGFIYSPIDKSLGVGPVNITGIGSQSGVLYVTSPATIVNPIFEICTDIYDMGSRKKKTISTVELGTDVTGDLWVALDYRMDKAATFKTLGWHKVSPNGVTNIPCYGVEFRVRVRRTTFAYFELDYIRVNGIVHDYSFQYPYVGR